MTIKEFQEQLTQKYAGQKYDPYAHYTYFSDFQAQMPAKYLKDNRICYEPTSAQCTTVKFVYGKGCWDCIVLCTINVKKKKGQVHKSYLGNYVDYSIKEIVVESCKETFEDICKKIDELTKATENQLTTELQQAKQAMEALGMTADQFVSLCKHVSLDYSTFLQQLAANAEKEGKNS